MDKKEYLGRIYAVMTYINEHIDSDLSLRTLAKVASFSPFHFHRIFKAVLGENVNDYVKRIRLEKAANLLLHIKHFSITDIALLCGFSSNSNFSRCFKEHFGTCAREFRDKESKICKEESKIGEEFSGLIRYDAFSELATKNMTMKGLMQLKVQIKDLPKYHVAYIRHLSGVNKGEYNLNVTESFERVARWISSKKLSATQTHAIGICYDNPEITPSHKIRYDAAFIIQDNVTETQDKEIAIQDVPTGKYAVYTIEVDNPIGNTNGFEQAIIDMGKAIDYLYGEWLPNNPYLLDDRPCLEMYYTERNAPKIVIDYCLPIQPVV
jgi:AraC family transcriptional regulator